MFIPYFEFRKPLLQMHGRKGKKTASTKNDSSLSPQSQISQFSPYIWRKIAETKRTKQGSKKSIKSAVSVI